MNRAAIVIGVNKTGKLPVLRSAASGAKRFGDWLAGEGFYVHVFVDDQNSVKARPIFEKIMRLVEKGTLDQLVVYFSGHGFLRGYSEYWMLSEAPLNPNEAISVRESIELARRCGIPNVIFVSDACRSAPQSIDAASVKGSLIFPSNEVVDTFPPEVDQFYAALPGKPAFETVVGESAARHEGIFTHCFLLAYSHPDNNMIHKVKDNSETIYVVPNRKLKKYLYREVREILRKKNFSIDQLPETRVESGENVYIGRVTVKGVIIKKKPRMASLYSEMGPTREPTFDIVDISEVARMTLSEAIGRRIDVPKPVIDELKVTADKYGFNESIELVASAEGRGMGHFETGSGFKVVGTRVTDVVGINTKAELLEKGDGTEPTYVKLPRPSASNDRIGHVSSVALRFDNGNGTVLAGLRNYIGTVVVEQGCVVNVSYLPSKDYWLWQEYEQQRDRMEKVRAIIASAAQYGVFRVDRENAHEIAHMIRYAKAVDPTLGLYAAYAYAEVGLIDQIKSVLQYMKNDISAMLFDVVMLAGELYKTRADAQYPVVPFCPMLSQGWTLLRVKKAEIPPAAAEAANYLLPALWSTFDSTGMDIILRAIRERRIS